MCTKSVFSFVGVWVDFVIVCVPLYVCIIIYIYIYVYYIDECLRANVKSLSIHVHILFEDHLHV